MLSSVIVKPPEQPKIVAIPPSSSNLAVNVSQPNIINLPVIEKKKSKQELAEDQSSKQKK